MQTSPKRPTALDLRRLVGSVNQLRFNDKQGEVSFFGQRMIILRRDVFRVMREGLERLVGDQAAPFLSFLASGIGIHEGSIFRDSVDSTGENRRASLENLVHTAFEDTNLGWGKIRVNNVNFDEGSANVSIMNCFEALENGPSEHPNCMFTSGFLAGLFAEVMDTTVQTNETRCISLGHAECEFQISPTKETSVGEATQTDGKGKAKGEKTEAAKDTEKVTPRAESSGKNNSGNKPVLEQGLVSNKVTEVEKSQKTDQPDFDQGVERASRIAKRKERFWNRMFK